MSWDTIRREFPALEKGTYLNTATNGHIASRSLAAMQRHFEQRNENAALDLSRWFEDMDAIRVALGTLVGCAGEDIAFMPNASSALSLMISGITWKTGDQILSFEGEFPNQLYYPSYLAAKGVELVVAPCGELLDHVTERTRLVAISAVSYSNGFVAPVQQLSQMLRARGILLYVDGTQSVGALQTDLQSIQPDMFAVHGYKWLLAPHGAAFAYVAPALRRTLEPAVIGWRSDRGWRTFSELNHGAPLFSDAAEKYEGGMPTFGPLYALGDSVRMMLELGPANIEARVLMLAKLVKQAVEEHGGEVLYQGSSVVAARFPGRDASRLAAEFKREGVIVAARHGNLRVSPHFYNNEEDIAHFQETLHRLL